jgi:hypothetical protein
MDVRAAARQMRTLIEPVHDVTYFTPAGRAAFEEVGLKGFWRGYFAGRAAPIGPAGPGPVIASFFVFAPGMVRRALPAVWAIASPATVLRARQAGAAAGLRELTGTGQAASAAPASLDPASVVPGSLDPASVDSAAIATAADQLLAAITELDAAGRTLAASNLELPVPDEPAARLWHAATVLREYRGDGHVAALLAADLDGAEALVLRVGVDLVPDGASHVTPSWGRDQTQPARGWTDGEWDAAVQRLADRGLLTASGTATPRGVSFHREIEEATDLAAARPWARLGQAATADLARALAPIARACTAVMPYPNPVGLPPPDGQRQAS